MPDESLQAAISKRRSQREFDDRQVPQNVLHRLLWAGQGITGEGGKRTAPSAHAQHPLELLVVGGNIENLEPGVHKVAGDCKTLSPVIQGDLRHELQDAALEEQPWIGQAAGIITVCADFAAPCRAFAEQPPYGTRGVRYVYIEAGAAAQNIQLMAVAEGLACVLVAGFEDEATSKLLGLEAPFAPILHICFGWPSLG